ncbi:MAG: hypothetical protein RLZZ45_1529 [Bacteroidota bacterium]
MPYQHFKGLIPAPFTPMHPDGSLNLDIIPDYFRSLVRNNIEAVFICGTTGEGTALTMAEKKAVAEAWKKASADHPGFRIMTMVGGTCIEDCIELAQHAKDTGLWGASLIAPYFFKPSSVEVLASFFTRVASSVPELPFYYYHIPVMTHVNFPMIQFLKSMDGRLENFAGIKYSYEDHMDLLSCLQYSNAKYDIFWGRDENLLSATVMGVKAAIGSTYNYMAPLYHDLLEAFKRGDLERARILQNSSIELIRLLGQYGGIGTGKAYMKLAGLDLGTCRLPNQTLDVGHFDQFSKEALSLGFDQFRMK